MAEGEVLKQLLRWISRKAEDPPLEGTRQPGPGAPPAEFSEADVGDINVCSASPRVMPAARHHHYFFAHEVLPAVFFSNPENFLFVLRWNGTEELQASWKRVGNKLEQSDRLPGTGLDCELRQLGDQMTIALITLPAPCHSPEAYFAAAVYRAARERESAMVRYFTLECRQPGPDQSPLVCEWTPQGTHHIRARLARAKLEPFFRCVCDMVPLVSA